MTRGVRTVLVLLLVIAAAWWLVTGRAPRGAKPTAGETVIAFGDSLIEGVGASPGHEVPALLSQRLGVPVINAGRRGDTASSALARLDASVLAQNPRVVIVLVGGNDFLRRVPRETTFEALEAIVTRIRERGAGVVLVGVSLGLVSDQYGDDYAALARHAGATLVPDVLGGIFGHPELMADQIHPNDRGYALMADKIAPAVREMLR